MQDKTRYMNIKENNLEITNIPCKFIDGEELISGKVMLDLARIKSYLIKNNLEVSITFDAGLSLIKTPLENVDGSLGISHLPEKIQEFIYNHKLNKNENYLLSATTGKGKSISAIKLSEKFIRENPDYTVLFISREDSPIAIWEKYSADIRNNVLVKSIFSGKQGKVQEIIDYNKLLISQITDKDEGKNILVVLDYVSPYFLRITRDIYNFNLNSNTKIQFLFIGQKNANSLNQELELNTIDLKDEKINQCIC